MYVCVDTDMKNKLQSLTHARCCSALITSNHPFCCHSCSVKTLFNPINTSRFIVSIWDDDNSTSYCKMYRGNWKKKKKHVVCTTWELVIFKRKYFLVQTSIDWLLIELNDLLYNSINTPHNTNIDFFFCFNFLQEIRMKKKNQQCQLNVYGNEMKLKKMGVIFNQAQ